MTSEEMIERVARAMAEADGLDPDDRASGGPNDFALRACEFNGYAVAYYGRVWETYRRQANLFMAARAALAGDSQ